MQINYTRFRRCAEALLAFNFSVCVGGGGWGVGAGFAGAIIRPGSRLLLL